MTVLCARGDRCRREGPRQAAHDSTLCAVCEDRMRENLRVIAAAWSDLEDAIVDPPSTGGTGERVQGGGAGDLVYGTAAADLAANIQADVYWWARILRDGGADPPQPWTAPALLRWIAGYQVGRLAQHELGADIADDAYRHRCCVTRVLDPNRPRRVDVPVPCPGWDDDDGHHTCTGTMYASVRHGEMPVLHCTVDRHHTITPDEYARDTWRRRAARAAWTSETA